MLKILVSHHAYPEVTSYTTILFRNVIPILQKTTEIEIIWAIHSNHTNKIKKSSENSTILQITNFKNGIEMIKTVKPDIVFIIPGLSSPDYAIYLAAKFLNLKIIGGQISGPFFSVVEKKNKFITYFLQSFQKTSLSKNDKGEREILRSQSLWMKYNFLFRTMKSMKMSPYKICKEFFEFILSHLSVKFLLKFNSKFKCDAIFVDSEIEKERKIQEGYRKKSLIVTGNPSYDQVIKNINENKISRKNQNGIKILFLTVNLEGQGGQWTRKKRDYMLKKFLRVCEKENYNVSIKIHPSGENLEEYKSIISSINPKIPIYQEESLVDCIKNTDIVFSMSSSTAGLTALFLKKPVIIWNFFNVKNDLFLENKLALECKKIEILPEYVKQSLKTNPASDEKFNAVVSKILYKVDGNASERIANEILKLVQK